jgi:hypothetical protein
MGLLDDAIREHLELKRLGGADPGDVARAEQDALGRVHREQESRSDEQPSDQIHDSSATARSLFLESELVSDADAPASNRSSQETVEINMEVELKRGIDVEHESDAPVDALLAPVGHPAHTQADREESTEWETSSNPPGERGGIAKSDSDTESRPSSGPVRSEHIENMTEEPHDFARETPEQKRRWFRRHSWRDSNK